MTPGPGFVPYLAGLFDGEGSFLFAVRLTRGKYFVCAPRLALGLRYGHAVLADYVAAFGGAVSRRGDAMYQWNLCRTEQVVQATEVLLPYLRIKRDIADRFLAAIQSMPPRHGRVRWNRDEALRITRLAQALNPPTAGKAERNAVFLAEISRTLAA